MTAGDGDSRSVELAAIATDGRGLVRRAQLMAAVTGLASGVLVAGIGFGARAVVHAADGDDEPPETTITTNDGTATTTETTGEQLTVPDVVGDTEESATRTREEAGFAAATGPVDAEGLASGIVFEQNPAAGTEAPAGTTVTLSVSTGPDVVTMPNVVGRTQPQAEAILAEVGLEVGSVTGEESAPGGARDRPSERSSRQHRGPGQLRGHAHGIDGPTHDRRPIGWS